MSGQGVLKGKSALVTGGTRGIGLAVSRALRRGGARVLAISNAEDQIDAFLEEFAGDQLAAAAFADVRDRGALEQVRGRLGGELDILIPNAGGATRTKFLELDDGPMREMLDTNLYGVLLTCQVFGALLNRKPGGRVVVMSSLTANHGMDLRVVYSATKGAVSAMVRALAVEWGPFGTTVNAVGPGVVNSPLVAGYLEAHPERGRAYVANVPMGRLGEPEDVADVVAFLASEGARYVSGQTILIDGGVSAGSAWW